MTTDHYGVGADNAARNAAIVARANAAQRAALTTPDHDSAADAMDATLDRAYARRSAWDACARCYGYALLLDGHCWPCTHARALVGALVGVLVNGTQQYGYVTTVRHTDDGRNVAHVCLRPGHYTHADIDDTARALRVI